MVNWQDDKDEIEKRFYDYFQELFTTSSPGESQINAALQALSLRVNTEMNDFLEQPFTAEEVTIALSQMCPTKGPDGLQAVFFSEALGISQRQSSCNMPPSPKSARYYNTTQSYIHCFDS